MDFEGFWAAAQPILMQVLYIVITVAVPIAVKAGMDWLKAQMADAEWAQAEKWADLVVQFLEQVGDFRGMDNAQKKEYAVNTIMNLGEGINLNVDRELADMLVEAAVKRLSTLQ